MIDLVNIEKSNTSASISTFPQASSIDRAKAEEVLFTCSAGAVVSPANILCDRADGGHLVVNPPRPVWERNCLTPNEIALWSLLAAATGQAMLDVLPQLKDACLNYWEAGNWALNYQAAPVGPKDVYEHRRVHLHIFGRNRHAKHPDWQWGESPRFPAFENRLVWSSDLLPLNSAESLAVGNRCKEIFTLYCANM